MNILDHLYKCGVIPVISLPDQKHALPLAESLLEGGLDCAEITFRTSAAAGSIELMRTRFPQLLVGAGTILSIEQADEAIDAGAQFIVSPGTNPPVIDHCLSKSVEIFPGICTPSEIDVALNKGLDVLKFFPAEPMGGPGFLKAICAPYKKVRFIPTGGIDPANLASYLALPQVVACGGSWMVKTDLMKNGRFDAISQLVREAVELVKKLR